MIIDQCSYEGCPTQMCPAAQKLGSLGKFLHEGLSIRMQLLYSKEFRLQYYHYVVAKEYIIPSSSMSSYSIYSPFI